MVISSFISSILILALGLWAYIKLESSMNIVAEKQLLIEPSKFSYKMWKDMPVTMYQSFTFFNLTNWQQVKSIGQKPRFVEVGPYVYRTVWTKSDINFLDEDRLINFAEKKQWIFQPNLSKGFEEDQIWTINTPLMTALALIQNAPLITRNIVSVILDGLGEGAFIKRNIKSLLFEGYSDLIVSVGPLFDRRFANFNGKFAYLYNKNDSVDGYWTVSTGVDDLTQLNKVTRFQSNIVNLTSQSTGQLPQGLNEVKPECAPAWSLDSATNGQLFAPFNSEAELARLQQQLQQIAQSKQRTASSAAQASTTSTSAPTPVKRFFSRSVAQTHHEPQHQQDFVPNPFLNQRTFEQSGIQQALNGQAHPKSPQAKQDFKAKLRDMSKFIFYPDLCRPIHLLPSAQQVFTTNGIRASRYVIDPRVFMNSSQIPSNKCFEMNPRPPLANTLAATINSVTGANVAMPNLVSGASSPFAMFASQPANNHHLSLHNSHNHHGEGLFERSNHPSSFLNNALHSLGATVSNNLPDQLAGSSSNANPSSTGPIGRLGRVRQLFSNIVSQRMSVANPSSLLPSLGSGPAGLLMGASGHHHSHNHHNLLNPFSLSTNARNSPDDQTGALPQTLAKSQNHNLDNHSTLQAAGSTALAMHSPQNQANFQANLAPAPATTTPNSAPPGGSDRWITQFRFKWPRGVFSIGQCQLGAPIYASLPHFLDADEYYLEQVDGLKPNRSLHEFYIDIESTLHSIPVNAKARLQLNVATPELRFRNIPNAMIPVLWQEVTFSIDKPIATMLFWSFTMSSTIYKSISIVLLLVGTIFLVLSFVGGYRQRKNRIRAQSSRPEPESCRQMRANVDHGADLDESDCVGNTSAPSWRLQQQQFSMPTVDESSMESHRAYSSASGLTLANQQEHRQTAGRGNDAMEQDERLHQAALNKAFSAGSCTEFIHHINCLSGNSDEIRQLRSSSSVSSSSILGPIEASGVCNQNLNSMTTTASSLSPKQPSSRASSHCELVVSGNQAGEKLNCAGCLLACLRHASSAHQHHLVTGTSDSSLVREASSSGTQRPPTHLEAAFEEQEIRRIVMNSTAAGHANTRDGNSNQRNKSFK